MGRQLALVVGVSNYPVAAWALPGVANDAREMAGLLAAPQGQFRGGDITVLTDERATAAAVTEALDRVLAGSSADDTVFVYLAGHGDIQGGDYYFVAYDTTLNGLPETGVPLSALKDRFDRAASCRVLVWLDFCHSGGVIERAVGGQRVAAARDLIERALQVVGRGKMIVTACTGSQTAKESPALGHGFFTHALLEGLKGAAADNKGRVLATTLYNYVVDRVQSETHDQCPVWHGRMEGHFVLMQHDPRDLAVTTGQDTGPSVGSTCEGSGDWVMLGDLFLRSDSVSQQGDQVAIETRPQTTEENASIQRLHSRDGRGSPVPFAHGDDAYLARVKDVASRSVGGQKLVTVSLTRENVRFGGGSGEPGSVQGFSADEIAVKRAGRLLLNDPPAPGPGQQRHGPDGFVEMYIRGMSGTRYAAERAVLAEVYADYNSQPDLILPLARLKLLYALRASDCVEEVLELRIGPIRAGRCHVRFRGRRARRYSNVPPHEFVIEGDCSLE